jgi:hypothetical protein
MTQLMDMEVVDPGEPSHHARDPVGVAERDDPADSPAQPLEQVGCHRSAPHLGAPGLMDHEHAGLDVGDLGEDSAPAMPWATLAVLGSSDASPPSPIRPLDTPGGRAQS